LTQVNAEPAEGVKRIRYRSGVEVMTTLDKLTEPMVRLFLRIDAAGPSDELLQNISGFWTLKRAGQVAPLEEIVNALPNDTLAHVFVAYLSPDGLQHWLVSSPGQYVSKLLSVKDRMTIDDADKRSAVRLRRLFDLVAEKDEPYSAMFETKSADGNTNLVEVFAAPLAARERGTKALLVAANSRVEQL